MKWIVIGGIIVLLIPFYVHLLSRSATLGVLAALKDFLLSEKEKVNGKKEE